jgi:hypothetical protein
LLADILTPQNRIDRLEARAFLRCHPAHILWPPFSSINEHLTIPHSALRIPHSGFCDLPSNIKHLTSNIAASAAFNSSFNLFPLSAIFRAFMQSPEELAREKIDPLLEHCGKKPEDAQNDRALCADIFADPSLGLPEALSRKELAAILSTTNKMRNDWSGHGGVVGQEEVQLRNERLLAEVQNLRGVIADTWVETQLVHGLHCRLRRDLYENEVGILMGSNTPFITAQRTTVTALDVEHLYLLKEDSTRALKLIPLIQIGPSPQSAKNACYFFNRLDRDGARFVSYHFTDQPEWKERSGEAIEAINFLTQV